MINPVKQDIQVNQKHSFLVFNKKNYLEKVFTKMDLVLEIPDHAENVNLICDTLIEAIVSAKEEAKKIYQSKKVCKNGKKPYITSDIVKLIKLRDKLFKKWKNAKHDKDKCRQNYTKARNQINQTICSAKVSYYQRKFSEFFGNIKNTWSTINEIIGRKKKHNIDDLIIKHFCSVKDLSVVVNNFAEVMIAQVENLMHSCEEKLFRKKNDRVLHSMVLPKLTKAELKIILTSRIKKSKAPGIDGITVSDISEDGNFNDVILKCINQSFEHGIVPNKLKTSVVRPVYKSGLHGDYNNYRPMSLLPLLSKIAEIHVSDKLTNFLEKFNVMDSNQFGFQRKRGTNDLLEVFASLINNSLNNHVHVLATFVDFSKAFDTLNHIKLLEMLENCGVRGIVLRWFEDYLKDRKFVVKVGESFSDEYPISRGVPQGSVLGPKLYALYVSDISQVFSSCRYYLFADDLVILSFHLNPEVARTNLQRELFQFQLWAHDKELQINNKKTVVMHI